MFGSSLCGVVYSIAEAAKAAFVFLDHRLEHVQKKDAKEEKKNAMKTVDDICDKGSLDDLLDIASKTFAVMLSVATLLVGCKSPEVIEVHPTKAWEGHYFTAQQFLDATHGIELEKGESAWVLSNRTLSRVLKEA